MHDTRPGRNPRRLALTQRLDHPDHESTHVHALKQHAVMNGTETFDTIYCPFMLLGCFKTAKRTVRDCFAFITKEDYFIAGDCGTPLCLSTQTPQKTSVLGFFNLEYGSDVEVRFLDKSRSVDPTKYYIYLFTPAKKFEDLCFKYEREPSTNGFALVGDGLSALSAPAPAPMPLGQPQP